MTIKSNGGVFGRNPTFNDVEVDGTLDVAGSITTGAQTVNGTLEVTKDDGVVGVFRRETSNGAVVQIYKDTNEAGRLGVFGTNDLAIGNNTCGIIFSDGLASIYPWSMVGSGSGQNGTLDLGYSGAGFRDLYLTGNVVVASGKGIDFSATAGAGTSELFDDYEEGAWTPVVADAASGGNAATAFAANGYYTKIGNIVHATCQLVNIDTTGLTAGNGVFVTGLPFSAKSIASSANFVTAVLSLNVTFSNQILAIIDDNTNYVQIVENVTNALFSRVLVSDLTSGSARLLFNITYEAA